MEEGKQVDSEYKEEELLGKLPKNLERSKIVDVLNSILMFPGFVVLLHTPLALFSLRTCF